MAESYPFDKAFERSIVALLVTSDRFFNLVGPHLEPDRFADPTAQVIAAQARALYEQVGKAPGSLAIILQRLRVQHDRGKLTATKLAACAEYLCDAEDAGLPDPDVAVHEVAAVLKRIKHQAALDKGFTTFAERGDMTEIAKEIESVEGIGRNDASFGSGFEGFAEELEEMGDIERLSTGFKDIDVAMDGGTARGEFWFWLAGPKVGKTMALAQNAAIMLLRGMHVAVATLELDAIKWRARVLGAVTGTPYNDIIKYRSKSVAFERLAAMQSDPDSRLGLGKLTVHKFGGHQTKLPEIFDWMNREEDRTKREIDGMVFDYPDKILGKDDKASDYLQMRDVYEGIRLRCETRRIWGWGASQAQRINLGELPTVNHCADSQHKVRVTDGMIGITRMPDDENKVRAKVLALRNGTGDGAEAGPLPNGFDYGCFVRNCVGGGILEIEAALKNGPSDPYDLTT